MSSLRAIQTQCDEDSHRWFPSTAQDLPFLTLCMMGEAGEFANKLKKSLRNGHHTYLNDNKLREELCEELTDAFIYLACIAELLQMDLEWWYNFKRNKNAERFPVVSVPIKDDPQA